MTPRPHTLTDGILTYTFRRRDGGLEVTRWQGDTWLVRGWLDAEDALVQWRQLRRAGYRTITKQTATIQAA